jgi:hypothetical protein
MPVFGKIEVIFLHKFPQFQALDGLYKWMDAGPGVEK